MAPAAPRQVRGCTKKFYDYLCEKNTALGKLQKRQAALMSGKPSDAGSATPEKVPAELKNCWLTAGSQAFFLNPPMAYSKSTSALE